MTLLVAGFPAYADSSTEVASQSVDTIKVFILAGQSNMDGRADGDKLSCEDKTRLKAVRDRVTLAYNRRETVPLGVIAAQPFVASKFNVQKTFGPELFFGLTVAEAWPDSRILLIKRSHPSASLHGSWNPDWSLERAEVMDEADSPRLYADLQRYVQETLSPYGQDEYEFAGMLWVQGESDSNTWKFGTAAAESYADNLRNLIGSIRADTKTPDLPFFMLQVGRGKVAAAMQRTAESMRNVFYIPQSFDPRSPRFLPRYDAPLGHYDYEGTRRIGELFGEAVLDLY